METGQTSQNRSSENKIFYVLIFVLSLLAIIFGTFWGQNNDEEIVKKCDNGAKNYSQCDLCPENKTLVERQCIDNIEEIIKKEPTDYEKFELYKKVSIYPDGLITPDDYMEKASKYLNDDGTYNIGRRIKISGEIEDAYIYIKAGANDGSGKYTSIDKKYDTVYFYIKNGAYEGGHLNLAKSKLGKTSELTEILFNLKNIPLAKRLGGYRSGAFISENLLADLKDGRMIGSIVNTNRYGKIENLIIAYKCVGNEDSCSIK